MDNTFLEAENIYLRTIEEDDLPVYFGWLNDQKTTKWMQRGIWPNNMDEMKSYYNSFQNGKSLFLAILAKKEVQAPYEKFNIHIGNIALTSVHPEFRTAEISIIIGYTLMQGKGYGSNAIKLLSDHAFKRMNLNRLQAGAVVENIGCIKAFKKNGFKEEGILRQAYYCEGEYRDVMIMGLIKEDWRKAHVVSK